MLLVARKLFPEIPAMNEPETRIELWKRLLQPSSGELLAELAAGDLHRISWLQALRESWGGELVSVGLELVEARRRAAVKFQIATNRVPGSAWTTRLGPRGYRMRKTFACECSLRCTQKD